MKRTFLFVISALMVLSILLVACANSGAQTTSAPQATETPRATPTAAGFPEEIDPAEYSGNILTAGSSTVYPLSERMAELFKEEGFEGKGEVVVNSVGSSAGFERFCVAGETDISNASRPIKDSEVESCRAIGREPVEFLVGLDALSVVVSQENDFVENLTLDQLAQVFSTATNWSDIDPAWPTEPIIRYIPGTDSGTFDFFVEVVFDKEKEPILNATNLNLNEDDNILVQGVEGSPYAIGFFGYAYYNENKDLLKAVSIEGVAPTEETAESGEYPLSRPLFLYSDVQIMQSKPQVAAFIKYYLDNVNGEILNVGYFPASQAALDEGREAWRAALK